MPTEPAAGHFCIWNGMEALVSSTISAHMELWQRRRELGLEVSKKRRLYLDVRFWNDLCDAELGVANSTAAQDLLRTLRSAITNDDLVCPVEFHVVEELHRQKIAEKRSATLALVDELSNRTVLVSPTERLFLEVLRLVQGVVAQAPPTEAPLEEMWTRPMFAAGHSFPELKAPELPQPLVEQLRTEMQNESWALGFVDLFAVAGPQPINSEAKAATADLLNKAKADPGTLFESYEATYWSEVRGSLDAYMPQLEGIWQYLFHRRGGDPDSITVEELHRAASKLRKVLYERARMVGLRHTVPTLHIGATLYSHLQWDRKRVYRGNDLFDFGHAEAALPYCHAFATDIGLASLIRQSGLTSDYPCQVLTKVEHVSDWVGTDTSTI